MKKFLTYGTFFVLLILTQVLLLDGINLSRYIYPMIYVAFILLLPMEMPPVAVLMLGLLTGAAVDIAAGSMGLNSIATILTAFLRPYILTLTIGRADVREGGESSARKVGSGKFLRYAGISIFIHCIVYFSFEALSWDHYHLTLLKAALSGAVTLALVYIVSLLFTGRG